MKQHFSKNDILLFPIIFPSPLLQTIIQNQFDEGQERSPVPQAVEEMILDQLETGLLLIIGAGYRSKMDDWKLAQ